tara:strand:+ start:131 stop:436 length:306 start_codon:yes stop_codon:yes gene_type:complete
MGLRHYTGEEASNAGLGQGGMTVLDAAGKYASDGPYIAFKTVSGGGAVNITVKWTSTEGFGDSYAGTNGAFASGDIVYGNFSRVEFAAISSGNGLVICYKG